jgi:hypothetical protein
MEQKMIAVEHAGMSMGKSHQLKNYLDKTKPKRVLMITSRRSLATTLKGGFPQFEMYTDNINTDWLICQYESIHRIRAPSPFDVVISDDTNANCLGHNRTPVDVKLEVSSPPSSPSSSSSSSS